VINSFVISGKKLMPINSGNSIYEKRKRRCEKEVEKGRIKEYKIYRNSFSRMKNYYAVFLF